MLKSNKKFYTVLVVLATVSLLLNSLLPLKIFGIYFVLNLFYQAHINVMLKRDPNYIENQSKRMDILASKTNLPKPLWNSNNNLVAFVSNNTIKKID